MADESLESRIKKAKESQLKAERKLNKLNIESLETKVKDLNSQVKAFDTQVKNLSVSFSDAKSDILEIQKLLSDGFSVASFDEGDRKIIYLDGIQKDLNLIFNKYLKSDDKDDDNSNDE